ncbi:hypothetical protein AB5I41_10850 [Sphingomonas sp. MMS24-JH45]
MIVEAEDGGNDSVAASVRYTLAANVENLTLTGSAAIDGTGNEEYGNRITGNGADNKLYGLGGNDWLDGKGGKDEMRG